MDESRLCFYLPTFLFQSTQKREKESLTGSKRKLMYICSSCNEVGSLIAKQLEFNRSETEKLQKKTFKMFVSRKLVKLEPSSNLHCIPNKSKCPPKKTSWSEKNSILDMKFRSWNYDQSYARVFVLCAFFFFFVGFHLNFPFVDTARENGKPFGLVFLTAGVLLFPNV